MNGVAMRFPSLPFWGDHQPLTFVLQKCSCLDPDNKNDSNCSGGYKFIAYKGDGNCDDESKQVRVVVTLRPFLGLVNERSGEIFLW